MNDYHDSARDTQELTDFDGGWVGVDMKSTPDRVPADKVAWALNKRFAGLEASPRRGIVEMTWADDAHTSLNGVFDAIAFSSDDDYDWLMRATADKVILSRPELEVDLALPGGVTLDADTQLVQAFSKVYLLRGPGRSPLVWTPGGNVADPSGGAFAALPSPSPSRLTMPQSTLAVWRAQRLWVAHDRDQVSPSDINVPHDYEANNVFDVEKGAHDSIVALYPFESDLIVLKGESIHALENINGDNLGVASREKTREFGAVAQRANAIVGKDFWFLSDSGVRAYTQVLDNRLQGQAAAVSRDVEPMLERMNKAAAGNAVAATWGGRYYLAIPVDDSATNNAVLVYDPQLQAWQGVDNSERHDVWRWVKMRYQGELRLFFVDTAGRLFLYEEGYEDVWDAANHPIQDEVITRGYLCGSMEHKVFHEAQVALATQQPQVQIYSAVNGMHDE